MSTLQIQSNRYYKSKFCPVRLALNSEILNNLRTKDAFQSATKDCCSKEKAKRVAITTFLSFPLQSKFQNDAV